MELIELKGGLVVSSEALALYFALENRGFVFRLGPDDQLLVGQGGDKTGTTGDRLTEMDRASIARLKKHLQAVLSYEAPPIT